MQFYLKNNQKILIPFADLLTYTLVLQTGKLTLKTKEPFKHLSQPRALYLKAEYKTVPKCSVPPIIPLTCWCF